MPVSHNNPFDQSGGHLDQHPNVAFEQDKIGNDAGHEMTKERSQSPREDRRMSREWGMFPTLVGFENMSIDGSPLADTSKVPPSQFQRRKGSIYATPGSRDGHVKGAERDKAYFDKLKEKVRRNVVGRLTDAR